MAVFFHSENITIPKINKTKIKSWLKRVIENENLIIGDINIIFTNNEYLLNINNKYLSHNHFTDIITFDYCKDKIVSGDLFLSLEMIKENAKKFNTSLLDEINRVIIHGILHLTGYLDKTKDEKEKMRDKENICLKLF